MLSFFVSPIIGSLWFFHRRMNKLGSLLLLIGVSITILFGLTLIPVLKSADILINESIRIYENYTIDSSVYDEYTDEESDEYGNYYDDDETVLTEEGVALLNHAAGKFMTNLYPYLFIWIFLSLLQIALSIVFGAKAKYWYMQDTVKKIHAVKENNGSPDDIAKAGGTRFIIWLPILITYIAFSVIATRLTSYYMNHYMLNLIKELNDLSSITQTNDPAAFIRLIMK